jgi:hypothetical protein
MYYFIHELCRSLRVMNIFTIYVAKNTFGGGGDLYCV